MQYSAAKNDFDFEDLRESDLERFWDKVDVRGPDECWVWTASLNNKGYGFIGFNRRNMLATRISYLIHNQTWPVPCCRHTCDNPSCVNPAHLVAGSYSQNTADAVGRGRLRVPVGEAHHKARLTKADVLTIRETFSAGQSTKADLSRRFGVSYQQIDHIVSGRQWKHVGGPVCG